MKKVIFLIFVLASAYSYGTIQVTPVNTATVNDGISGAIVADPSRIGSSQMTFANHLRLRTVDKSVLKENIDLEKKKYLTYSFEKASVDNYDTRAYVRYNIFNDEIEFIKEMNIYYLVKEVGRKIKFTRTGITYKVFKLDKENHFFKVHLEDKYSLVAKQKVRYIEPKVAKSGYDRAKPGDYRRVRDELYLASEDNKLTKIPHKKKEFYSIFGGQSEAIKKHVKSNKLNYKKLDDLKNVVQYYNSLLNR